MTYIRARGLSGFSGIDFTADVNANGGTPAQAAALTALSAKDTSGAGAYGNLPPQYAGLVMHADGSLGPGSDLAPFIAKYSGQNQSGSYWQGILNSNRYLVLMNAAGEPLWSVGAIAPDAAAAVIATYAIPTENTQGQAQSTAATAAADAAAQLSTKAAQAAMPVAIVSNIVPVIPVIPPVAVNIQQLPGNLTNLIPMDAGAPAINEPGGGNDIGVDVAPANPPQLLSLLPSWVLPVGLAGVAYLLFGRKKA